jgi:hypothetical protein
MVHGDGTIDNGIRFIEEFFVFFGVWIYLWEGTSVSDYTW